MATMGTDHRWYVEAVNLAKAKEVDFLLDHGWEPFAVVFNGSFNSLFLRRQGAPAEEA